MVKVLIAEQNPLLRDGIAALVYQIAPEIEVDLADTQKEVIVKLQAHDDFAVALLDKDLLESSKIEEALWIARRFPHTKTVIMAEAADSGDLFTAISSGLMGYLLKTMSGQALVNALRLIASGESHFPTSALPARKITAGTAVQITTREREIVDQLVLGLSNKEIGARLGLEETTVKSHLRSLSVKLGARNRTDVALRARAQLIGE
jgi:DNA-binding NarL/FixJ family response regulator